MGPGLREAAGSWSLRLDNHGDVGARQWLLLLTAPSLPTGSVPQQAFR